jgi:hypothetical protein
MRLLQLDTTRSVLWRSEVVYLTFSDMLPRFPQIINQQGTTKSKVEAHHAQARNYSGLAERARFQSSVARRGRVRRRSRSHRKKRNIRTSLRWFQQIRGAGVQPIPAFKISG